MRRGGEGRDGLRRIYEVGEGSNREERGGRRGWDGMGWDGMGWDGMGGDGMGAGRGGNNDIRKKII